MNLKKLQKKAREEMLHRLDVYYADITEFKDYENETILIWLNSFLEEAVKETIKSLRPERVSDAESDEDIYGKVERALIDVRNRTIGEFDQKVDKFLYS